MTTDDPRSGGISGWWQMTAYGHIDRAARLAGWEVEDTTTGNVGLGMVLTRGSQWVQLLFDSQGAVDYARVGKAGGHDIPGPDKRLRVIELLTRDEEANAGAQERRGHAGEFPEDARDLRPGGAEDGPGPEAG